MADKIDLKSLSVDQLNEELAETEGTYHTLKFNHSIEDIANPSQLKSLRRKIARIKTELRARELQTSEEPRDRIRARRRRHKKIKK